MERLSDKRSNPISDLKFSGTTFTDCFSCFSELHMERLCDKQSNLISDKKLSASNLVEQHLLTDFCGFYEIHREVAWQMIKSDIRFKIFSVKFSRTSFPDCFCCFHKIDTYGEATWQTVRFKIFSLNFCRTTLTNCFQQFLWATYEEVAWQTVKSDIRYKIIRLKFSRTFLDCFWFFTSYIWRGWGTNGQIWYQI